jgi:hypothetical protein
MVVGTPCSFRRVAVLRGDSVEAVGVLRSRLEARGERRSVELLPAQDLPRVVGVERVVLAHRVEDRTVRV